MAKTKINTGMVFERHEKKFMVPAAGFPRLAEALAPYVEQDGYGLHTICTIYYDTEDFTIIRHSLDKPKFKEKLRLRSYGVPREQDDVYLELKKKLQGVTYKRRIALPLWQAREYLEHDRRPQTGNRQIMGEIDWFRKQNRPSPKALICYDRIAMAGRQDEGLRITFDGDIRWRDHSLDLGKGDYGVPLLPIGTRLMEVKAPGALPLWLCRLLSEQGIYPQSFSKYGTVYRDCLMNGHKEAFEYAG